MSATGERSARDYSREADATRQRITQTMEELADRLTVGQVLDEVLGYAKGGGGTMASALTRAARDNPIPSLLVSAGCMMFLSDRLGLPRRAVAAKGVGIRVAKGAKAAQNGLSEVGDNIGKTGRQLRDGAANAAQSAGETVKEYSEAFSEQVGDFAGQAQEQLMTASQQLTQQARRLLEEQPLFAGAIALAIGAGIAAVLPKTETEQEYMGEASKAVKEAATEFAEKQYENAKDVVGRVSEAAISAAGDQGLTGSGVKHVAEDVTERVSKVARAATNEAISAAPGKR